MAVRRSFLFLALMSTCPSLGVAQEVSFDTTIAPLLTEHCIDCHGGLKPKGKLDLTRKASAAKVLADDVLWKRVDAGEMPPKKPLSVRDKAVLKRWLDDGATWGTDPINPFRITTSKRAGYDWWAFQAIKRPTPPNVQAKDWPRNPIDQFVLAKLEAEGLAPSPAADARTFLRRLHFDLVGLPPRPVGVAEFVATGGDANAKRGAVDRLLGSPHYGERWARHWLDVVRFGESHGFEHDELRTNAWPYRDWVIDALNKDMPYDEFARLQIAGDVLKSNEPSAIMATGFLVAGGYDSVGQGQQSAAMKAVVRQDELEDIVGTISQTFLGLTVQCARCHDHKFDPVRSEEYYQLTAAVAGVRHGERNVTSADARAAFDKQRVARLKEIDGFAKSLRELEQPIREKILAERRKGVKAPTSDLPKPAARWDFTKGLRDEIGSLDARLHGDAKQNADGLQLSGAGYAATTQLQTALRAKTLSVVVRLTNLTQRGGAAICLQNRDGSVFDAIVLGEREPKRWLAGSDFFRRTQDFKGSDETDLKPVHIAITYAADGTIACYRNGVPYGQEYKTKLQSFEPGEALFLFGLRHTPPGGTKHLAGSILRAEYYDRALTPTEVAATAGAASDFVSDAEIEKHLDARVIAKRIEFKDAIKKLEATLTTPPASKAYVVVPRTPEATHFLIRGNPAEKGPLLASGGVASLKLTSNFAQADASDAERRRKLAEWITDANNPLFARVMVNRLWHYHFGVGLVDTPSDFGFNGGRPSHPELLDWLADEFIRSKYSVKHMHRLIVTSATYAQASRHRPEAAKRDANNRWLWRYPPHRLEAEALRDTLLVVAGQLNDKQGGPGYQDFKVSVRGATYNYTPIDTDDPALYRRSVYRTWARSGRNGLLDAHDCPDPSATAPRRTLTTTPLQALALMNNAFVLRMADRFAERLKKEAGEDVGKQIGRGFELAYGRRASDAEIAAARPVVEQHGLAAFCRAVINSNEFVYVD
jgi:hypothetical protein